MQDGVPPAEPEGSTTVLQPVSASMAESAVLRSMAADWHDGGCQPAEIWLSRHPELSTHSETAVRVVYEEICLREERGEQVPSAEIYRRFPQWKADLEMLFDCHRMIDSGESRLSFPEVGTRLGELQLLRKLGRGAVGQVFLATQPSLSDRLLVVKLTSRSGGEHLSLARLQHTHIAPLYLVQDFPEENLRALCMPYLGGASWASLLHALRAAHPERRSGRQIVGLLAAAQREAPPAPSYTSPALRFLYRANYQQAVCWIGSCLADALQYAHQCGLVHLDIKPSNVLLAGDGQPMLLDFHLAREVVVAGAAPPDQLGGTQGYMSPEQELAAEAVRNGRTVPMSLGGRSDIYSLGVLLYESLSGHLPPADVRASRRALRASLSGASRGLEDLVHKCLAPSPEDRYRDAGQLAADLRRHLADLPLQGVPNRSPLERVSKWRRRKPHAFVLLMTISAALAAGLFLGLMFLRGRVEQASAGLDQARQDFESHDYESAINGLENSTQAIGWVPGHYDLKRALANQLARSKRGRLAEAMHVLVQQLRFLDSLESAPPARMHDLAAGCARLWQARSKLMMSASGTEGTGDSVVATELLDFAALWAELTVRLAPEGRLSSARREAIAILDQAEALIGSSLVLELARRECTTLPAPVASSRALPPAHTAWEHHVLGRHLFRNGDYEQAQTEFARAIEREPGTFWPNFYAMLCAYRRERFDEALNEGFVCVALAPGRPECFYNRALCHQALGHLQKALDDFQTALALGIDPVAAHFQMAVIQHARHDRAAALVHLREVLARDANYAPALALKDAIDAQL